MPNLARFTLPVFAVALAGVYARFVWTAGSPPSWGSFELLAPRMLGLGLLAPYFLWVLTRSLADLPFAQRVLAATLRIAFVVLLALGLSRLVRTSTTQKVCTVYLVDVSESVPDAALDDARKTLEQGLASRPSDALIRLITFAARPRVVPLAVADVHAPPLVRHEGTLGAATDVASALQLAVGLYPSGYLRHAVLLTDGVQTDGDMVAEANRARAFGVKLFTVPFRRPVPGEVAIRDLAVPARIRVGETFDLHGHIFASRAQTAKLVLKQGEAINGLDGVLRVDLKQGDNDIRFKSVVRVAGDVTYSLEVSELVEDHFADNNRFVVSAAVPGRPSVLYVEGAPNRASYLSGALVAQDFDVDVRGPRELPSSLRELERYDFVILSDTPAEAVSLNQQEALEHYVRDVGGGFLFAGGESGFGLGGWNHTTVARLLPVHMDSEKKRDEPGIAMVLAIDRSGSMSGLPLEMAKAAARATADVLQNDDLLEVIAFDTQPTRVVRLTAAKHRARIQSDIARVQPGGGTEIFAALDAAYQSLSVARARKKHIILLTDGQAPAAGIRDLTQAMVAENITVSAVGLGGGVDDTLLRMVSDLGGGRFYKVSDPQTLPRIFTRETEMVSRSAVVEEYFQPRLASPADFLRGIDVASAPFLHGYVATKPKPSPAQMIFVSEVGEPILARWHVGLGWSLAWTSDVKNFWAVEWLRWPSYGPFWGQLVREHMRQKRRQQLDMTAELDAATGRVHASVDAVGGDDRFQNGLHARFEVTGPEPSGVTKQVDMRQTAPGRYEADFPLDRFGAFLLRASLEQAGASVAESSGHISNPYPREYLALAADVASLKRAAELTGGSVDPSATTVFDPAGAMLRSREELWPRFIGASLVLFVLDLLVRRVRLFDRKRTLRPTRAPARA